MWKFLETNFTGLSTHCKDKLLVLQESCIRKIKEATESSEKEIALKDTQLKNEFTLKLTELHTKWEEAEQTHSELLRELENKDGDNNDLKNQIHDLNSILAIKDRTIEKVKIKVQTCNELAEQYYIYYLKQTGKDLDIQGFSKLDLSEKITKIQGITRERIDSLEKKMEKEVENRHEEMDKMKKEYQDQIDSLHKESWTQIQKINDLDWENNGLKNEIQRINDQMEAIHEQVISICTHSDLSFLEDSRIDNKLQVLNEALFDKTQLLEKYKTQNEEKAQEIERLTTRNRTLRDESRKRESKIKKELDRSKEEISIKNQQIEVTEKVLEESRQLLSKSRYPLHF